MLSIFITGVNSIPSLTSDSITASGGTTTLNLPTSSTCATPRDTGNKHSAKCSTILGDNVTCESFDGCTYETGSSISLPFIGQIYQFSDKCSGVINASTLGYTGTYGFNGRISDDICELSGVISTPGVCTDLGCTWFTENDLEDLTNQGSIFKQYQGVSGLIRTVGDVFTLDVTFSSNTGYNALIKTFLIVIPYIILVLSIIMLLLG